MLLGQGELVRQTSNGSAEKNHKRVTVYSSTFGRSKGLSHKAAFGLLKTVSGVSTITLNNLKLLQLKLIQLK